MYRIQKMQLFGSDAVVWDHDGERMTAQVGAFLSIEMDPFHLIRGILLSIGEDSLTVCPEIGISKDVVTLSFEKDIYDMTVLISSVRMNLVRETLQRYDRVSSGQKER